jgi:hypothetical protein
MQSSFLLLEMYNTAKHFNPNLPQPWSIVIEVTLSTFTKVTTPSMLGFDRYFTTKTCFMMITELDEHQL